MPPQNPVADFRSRSGFSVVEVMLAISISSIFFTTAALVYQNVTANSRRLASMEKVALGEDILQNFYNLTGTDSIRVYSAPNYGRAAFANELREVFRDDLDSATAVYCLGRQEQALNVIRPVDIEAADDLLDTPEKFRQHLLALFPADAGVYVPYEQASTAANATIYLTGRSSDPARIPVNAIYEIDILPYPLEDPESNYISVRRYVGQELTHYYDILYEIGSGLDFSPLVVFFSRRNRSYAEPSDFNVAYEHPFYLIWWPDPAAHYLESPAVSTVGLSSPMSTYYHMGGRTSFMFAVPAFPAQL